MIPHAAVNDIFSRGWLPHPLRPDGLGFPKIPIVPGWQSLKRDPQVIRSLPWADAAGVGIVLGAASGGLAVIDLDDLDLTRAVFALFVRSGVQTRLVFTARQRGHVYVRESTPSPSTVVRVRYQGREIKIELKSNGTQVAAPPTPGYAVGIEADPIAVPSIRAAWDSIHPRVPGLEVVESAANFPRPWQATVPAGERNQTAYIEAHRLREAGIPLDQALEFLGARVRQRYEQGGGLNMRELEKTIGSAYRAGLPAPRFGGGVPR